MSGDDQDVLFTLRLTSIRDEMKHITEYMSHTPSSTIEPSLVVQITSNLEELRRLHTTYPAMWDDCGDILTEINNVCIPLLNICVTSRLSSSSMNMRKHLVLQQTEASGNSLSLCYHIDELKPANDEPKTVFPEIKKHARFPKEVTSFLSEYFKEMTAKYLSEEDITAVGEKTGLTRSQIHTWWSNHRRKEKNAVGVREHIASVLF